MQFNHVRVMGDTLQTPALSAEGTRGGYYLEEALQMRLIRLLAAPAVLALALAGSTAAGAAPRVATQTGCTADVPCYDLYTGGSKSVPAIKPPAIHTQDGVIKPVSAWKWIPTNTYTMLATATLTFNGGTPIAINNVYAHGIYQPVKGEANVYYWPCLSFSQPMPPGAPITKWLHLNPTTFKWVSITATQANTGTCEK
jgi:hypothetical protein